MNAATQTDVGGARKLFSGHAAAVYGAIGRLWLVLTGPVTIVLLAISFTPSAQGYFFTFISLAAARTVAELGLGQVIIVKMAQLCPTTTNPANAVSPQAAGLIRFAAKWFAGAGFLVSALLCVGGTVVLGASNGLPTAEWLPPWVALSLLAGLDVALSGLLFAIEGAGQVRSAYLCRMVRSFVNSLVMWLLILIGLQLWSISIALACNLAWTTYFLFTRGKLVVAALRPDAAVAKTNWLSEVLPFQWRLALSSLATYASSNTMIPLMYVMHGAVIAGQLGVTWQLALAVESIAGAIVSARFPEFSRLAGARSIRELDTLLLSTSLISMAICLLGSLGVSLGVLVLEKNGLEIATRLLPFDEVVILMSGLLIWNFNLTIVAYLRAHGGDPFLPASLIGSVLLLAVTLTLGRWFGTVGLLWGFAVTGACFMVPFGFYLLQRKRRTWGYPPFKIEGIWAALVLGPRDEFPPRPGAPGDAASKSDKPGRIG